MFGFLPPSSSATFFTVPDAAAMIRLPVARPPVNETRSTLGSSLSGAPALGPSPRTRFADPGGQPGLGEQLHQVDRGVRGELARLQHEGAARGERRARPSRRPAAAGSSRGDQPADADGLVHHPADHVVAPGVDDPARLGVRHQAEVMEDAGDVVDVDLALDQALAGVERLHSRPSRPCRAGAARRPGAGRRLARGRWWLPRDRCRRQPGRAAMADSVSAAVDSSISATSSPSAGQRISRRPPCWAATHSPSMKFSGNLGPSLQTLRCLQRLRYAKHNAEAADVPRQGSSPHRYRPFWTASSTRDRLRPAITSVLLPDAPAETVRELVGCLDEQRRHLADPLGGAGRSARRGSSSRPRRRARCGPVRRSR